MTPLKNKPYFTKYLPAEGEIKEGDYAIDDNIMSGNKIVTIKEIHRVGNMISASDGRGWYSTEGFKKLKKVKLKLCSRDIQVGDKVRGPIYEQELIVSATELSKGAYKNCFKVIGEISPKATFVIEMMEFDEDEVDIYYQNKHLPDDCFVYPDGITEISDKIERYKVVVRVECPHCGTFI